MNNLHSQLQKKCKITTENISDDIQKVVNKPASAFYRIQEHVENELKPLIDLNNVAKIEHSELKGQCYDLENAVCTIKSMKEVGESLKRIEENLKTAIYIKQQLKHEELRKENAEKNSVNESFASNVYQKYVKTLGDSVVSILSPRK